MFQSTLETRPALRKIAQHISAIVVLFLFLSNSGQAQGESVSEDQAKQAVNKIVRYCGLHQNFVVRENSEVKTAVAFIKNKKRYIEYNPHVFQGLVDSTSSDWTTVSILAHEIAHHLLGHTLDPSKISPGDELACDKFSGFILESMGATEEESIQAMEIAGNPIATKKYPPKESRLSAISSGYRESKELDLNGEIEPIDYKRTFKYKVNFGGDENNYYINEANKLLWFNNFAEPIEFGVFQESSKDNFAFELSWENQIFYVDFKNLIWRITDYNAQSKVGHMMILELEE